MPMAIRQEDAGSRTWIVLANQQKWCPHRIPENPCLDLTEHALPKLNETFRNPTEKCVGNRTLS